MTEAEVERACCELLQSLGYLVLKTTHRVRKCHRCGAYPKSARYGATRGIPDLFFRHDAWAAWYWLGVELKRPGGGRLSPAQRDLVLRNGVAVVDDLEDLLAVLRRVDPGRVAGVTVSKGV